MRCRYSWRTTAAPVQGPKLRWQTGPGGPNLPAHQTRGADRSGQDGHRAAARFGRQPKRRRDGALLFDAWLDHIEPHGKPSTIDWYRRKVKGRIIPAFGHVRIDRLTPKRLDDQHRAWREEGLSPSTVRLCHPISVLRSTRQ